MANSRKQHNLSAEDTSEIEMADATDTTDPPQTPAADQPSRAVQAKPARAKKASAVVKLQKHRRQMAQGPTGRVITNTLNRQWHAMRSGPRRRKIRGNLFASFGSGCKEVVLKTIGALENVAVAALHAVPAASQALAGLFAVSGIAIANPTATGAVVGMLQGLRYNGFWNAMRVNLGYQPVSM